MHHYGVFDSGYSGGWMVLHSGYWLLLLAALVAGAVLLWRSADSGPKDGVGRSALEILDERYARGEIDREEYLQRRKDILDGQD